GGQGCEDWKLYCQIARTHRFAVVPEFLTGYRVLSGNMSSDVMQMLRSHELACQDLLEANPELAPAFHHARNRLSRFMLHRAIKEHRFDSAGQLLGQMWAHDRLFLAATLAVLPLKLPRALGLKLLYS